MCTKSVLNSNELQNSTAEKSKWNSLNIEDYGQTVHTYIVRRGQWLNYLMKQSTDNKKPQNKTNGTWLTLKIMVRLRRGQWLSYLMKQSTDN